MYFAFLFKKQNQKAFYCALPLWKKAATTIKYMDMLRCSIEKMLTFMLCNSKIQLMSKRAAIALKPSFCLLNYGLCQEPTQPQHYSGQLVCCLALQGCFTAASECCSRSE